MKTSFIILFLFSLLFSLQAQLAITWQKSLGGSDLDEAYAIRETSDGGFVVAGKSVSADGFVTNPNGGFDLWVVKLDTDGEPQWEKSFLTDNPEIAYSIQQTLDGGYIIAGSSQDISTDVLVVKIDSSGELEWSRTYGGSETDIAYSIVQAADGGYVFAGESNSQNGDVTENMGAFDYWIARLDGLGNLLWEKSLGGTQDERANFIQNTEDGGFVIAGQTFSNDGHVSTNNGLNDFWIVRIDSLGGLIWQSAFGGTLFEEALSIEPTTDNGYIVSGYTYSNDGDVTFNNGSQDVWVIKLDNAGLKQWERSFGGTGDDIGFSIIPQPGTGGYMLAAGADSDDGNVTENLGKFDYWVIQMDTEGNLQEDQSYGGSNFDVAYSIRSTQDGGYVVAGYSNSSDGDITDPLGHRDYWIVRLSPIVGTKESTNRSSFSLYPNPAGAELYIADKPCDKIEIINSIGEVVKSFYHVETFPVDISDLDQGIYFLKLSSSDQSFICKFVKQDY